MLQTLWYNKNCYDIVTNTRNNMFTQKFNKYHAIELRQCGFSASEISEFMGCSKDWVYGVVKQKPNPEKRKELMQLAIDKYEKEEEAYMLYLKNSRTCIECGTDFDKDSDYDSDEFCSGICHARHVLDDDQVKEIYREDALNDKTN